MTENMVTVVTVCRNAEGTIRDTICSVLNQTYRDFEYLVVDGVSTDRTYDIVCRYDDAFRERGITYRHISEGDTGIYDAMNKGIALCEGEWVLLLNADDTLCDENVLWDVFQGKDWGETEIIYGDSIRSNGVERKEDLADKPLNILKKTKFFCHQAVFTKTTLARELRYDCQFKICADYDFFLRAYLQNRKFSYIHRTICVYSVLGTSNKHYYKTLMENYNVRIKNGMDRDSIIIRLKALKGCIKRMLSRE